MQQQQQQQHALGLERVAVRHDAVRHAREGALLLPSVNVVVERVVPELRLEHRVAARKQTGLFCE